MTKLTWHTEKRCVADLVPNDKNPRIMSPKQVEDLTKSLKKFNLVEIPVVDADNKVLAGHQRLVVLKLLGRDKEEIEVRVPNRKLTQSEYDQYLLTSNRVHGDWDWAKLADGFDVDLLLDIGFDNQDLENIWNERLETEDDEFDVTKEIAAIKKPVTKPGTLYALGSHRLLCGDSTKAEDVALLVGKREVGFIACDPPYNIGLSYDKGVGTSGKYGGHKTNDSLSDKDYRAFIKKTMENALSVARHDVHAFYWCDESYIYLMQELFREFGLTNRRVCIWLKDNANPTPGVAFNKVSEPCVYATRGKPYLAPSVMNLNEVLNKEVGTGNQLIDDVLDLLNVWLVKRLASSSYEHPTSKNPTLHEKSLRRCTKPGDYVLDLFGGSGSTLIACEQLKRRALLCEQEPIFCDVIVKRYEKLTGKKAEIISS